MGKSREVWEDSGCNTWLSQCRIEEWEMKKEVWRWEDIGCRMGSGIRLKNGTSGRNSMLVRSNVQKRRSDGRSGPACLPEAAVGVRGLLKA